MSVLAYAIFNAVLAIGIVGAVAGLQLWGVLTQHRDHGCEDVRLRRPRARIAVSLPELPKVEAERPAREVVLG